MTFIDRWSDNIGLDRDRLPSWHYQPSCYTSHTMKSSDPLLLTDGNLRWQSCHLSTPNHPRVPPVWPYCRQAQCGRWHSLKWSIADLLTSQSSSNISLPFCLDYRACNRPQPFFKCYNSFLKLSNRSTFIHLNKGSSINDVIPFFRFNDPLLPPLSSFY